MEKQEKSQPDFTLEVRKRSFYAICKVIADGVPNSSEVGSPRWCEPTTKRALTDQEVAAAKEIAHWIEDAAIDLCYKLVHETGGLVKDWIAKKKEVSKFKKGLTSNEGRKLGAKTNKEKADAHLASLRKATFDYLKSPASSGQDDATVARFLMKANLHQHPNKEYTLKTMTARVAKLRAEFIENGGSS